MVRRALLWFFGRELRELSFPDQRGEGTAQATGEILKVFYSGLEVSLRQASAAQVRAAEARTPWQQRFFFWEGFALGKAATAATRLGRPNPDTLRATDHFRSMHFTGYGFWNGLSAWMPGLPLRTDEAFWGGVADYPRLGALVAGGAAFAEVAFGGELDLGCVRRAEARGGPDARIGALHGCGRALWWLYMNNPEGAQAALDLHKVVAAPLAEGIGLAIGFVNLTDPLQIERWVRRFSPEMHASLMAGVGVCLQALTEEHPDYGARVRAIPSEPLAQVQRAAQRVSAGVEPGWGSYQRWVDAMRLEMASLSVGLPSA